MSFIILLLHLFSKSLVFHYFIVLFFFTNDIYFAWLLKDVISCASREISHMTFSASLKINEQVSKDGRGPLLWWVWMLNVSLQVLQILASDTFVAAALASKRVSH